MNTPALPARLDLGRRRHTSRRGVLVGLFMALAATLMGGLFGGTAHAVDNTLVSSTPATGSTVDTSPTEVVLVFANQLGASATVSMTCGSTGTPISLGAVEILADGVTLRVPLAGVAPKGPCAVAYSVTDTNLQAAGSGALNFTVANDPVATSSTTTVPGATSVPGATATTVAPTPGSTSTADDGEPGGSEGPLALFRLFSNLFLAIVLGSIVVIAVVWPEGIEYILTVRFLRYTWAASLVSSVLYAGALAANTTGASMGSTLLPTSWGDLFDTTPGIAAVLRFVFVAATFYVISRPERIIDTASQIPAFAPPVLSVVTIAFSRDEFGLIDITIGIVHALAMAVWLGGLVLLARVVLAGSGDEDLVHAVRGFARISTPALWATVVSGGIQFFILDRGALGTSHGLVVILKVAVVAGMVFVGVAARQFITQRMNRVNEMSSPLAARLRRAFTIEAALGVVVLLLTSWLLTLVPAGLGGGDAPDLDLGVVHRFTNPALGVEVDVAFTEVVGVNDVRIEVVTAPTGGVSGLMVDFVPPTDSGINGMRIIPPLTGLGAAALDGKDNFLLNAAGTWTVIVTVNTSAGPTEVARQSVVVGDQTTVVTVTVAAP